MYSAEIAGDEEDEEEAEKNAALTEEELAAKKVKEDRQFKWLLIYYSSNFYCSIHCGFHASALCTGQSVAVR